MRIWHLTPDARRIPERVSPGERVALYVGTWPIEPEQAVWITSGVRHADGTSSAGRVDAAWERNDGANSYWRADVGPFVRGDDVTYVVRGRSPDGEVEGPTGEFRVGPKLHLALLWHQHQPVYRDTGRPVAKGSYLQPWVRLHAIRDYYAMAALAAEHPGLHLTINLTPSLLWQIEDYVDRGATDRALELTLTPPAEFSTDEREELLSSFFDADWHHQIFPHPRYKELFTLRLEGRPFGLGDLRDLQMWFSLAWFGKEFRDGEVELATGERVSVAGFVRQGRNFSPADVRAMVGEQYKIMRAVVPLHRMLQERGQLEISTTPCFHPILPLLVDTDLATIDRPGAARPPRFAHPEDAEAHVRLAVDAYRRRFDGAPRGMWPAEGAVSESVVPILGRAGLSWVATDRGVLARSGEWGYDVENPDVLCQAYRAEADGQAIAVFFRDTQLSDGIGYRYHAYDDYEQAARDFLREVKERFAWRVTGEGDRVLSVVLDGENAWGAYRDDARPFLRALYRLLAADTEVETVTFAEYLGGNEARGIRAHPIADLPTVYALFTGSWIDEGGSLPGVDLGTWIGESEENRGWELLGEARDHLARARGTPEAAAAAFQALYIAEGSDWFWWLGGDQESENDSAFDDLFRIHLTNVYRSLGEGAPAELDRHIVAHAVLWTFTRQVDSFQPGDRLTVRTNCPGVLTWQLDGATAQSAALGLAGGVMAGARRHQLTVGPFPPTVHEVAFRFRCTHPGCECRDLCCRGDEYRVRVASGR